MSSATGWTSLLTATRTADRGIDPAEVVATALTLATDITPAIVGASLTVRGATGFSWTTPHAWRSVALTLDLAQYRDGTGPCIDAATHHAPVHLHSIRSDARYPGFAQVARDHKVHSSLSMPLSGTSTASALNLYAGTAGAFDSRRAHQVADLLARALSSVLGGATAVLDELVDGEHAAGSAVRLARVRGQAVRDAVVVLADETGTTYPRAYRHLAEQSSRQQRTLPDIAEQVLREHDRNGTTSA